MRINIGHNTFIPLEDIVAIVSAESPGTGKRKRNKGSQFQAPLLLDMTGGLPVKSYVVTEKQVFQSALSVQCLQERYAKQEEWYGQWDVFFKA